MPSLVIDVSYSPLFSPSGLRSLDKTPFNGQLECIGQAIPFGDSACTYSAGSTA
jgi:hypothetical protein